MPLSATAVKDAKPSATPKKLSDEKGLFLLVNPTGSRLWRLKYRFAGKEKLLALGSYPEVSLKQARDRRDEARRKIADNIDPSAERKASKNAATGADLFKAIADEWLKLQKPGWAPGHTITVQRRLERDVYPYIGTRPIKDIDSPALLTVLRRVESRGAIETAHRVKTVLQQVFSFAIGTGAATRNPVTDLGAGVLTAVVPKPMAAILEPAAVGGLLRAIDDYRGTHIVRCAFKLAPLVFVRPGELRAAEWAEFDLEAAQWVIPAKRMKLSTKAKEDEKRSHIVPLSTQAVEILKEIQELTGEGIYVFPSARSNSRPMSENAITAALRRMGFTGEQMTGHGFRSIASTILNEKGHNPDAIEVQLAHGLGSKTRAAYNRAKYLPERRQMMQEWADILDVLKAGKAIPERSALK